MNEKIFDQELTNRNTAAFIVPTEEGADELDRGHGSIGDATMRHVSNLPMADRQLWENLIITKSGGIFRTEPSTDMFDSDPMNLRGEDLDEFLKRQVEKRVKASLAGLREGQKAKEFHLSESELAVLREVEEEERARRGESEDAYDRSETIPYAQLEQYPGMEKHINMPRSPKDRLWYMGNCNQLFYDHFPEDHPEAKLINVALGILNKNPEEITESFIGWFEQWLTRQTTTPEIRKGLSRLANDLLDEKLHPCRAAENALDMIDDMWRVSYMEKSEQKSARDVFLHMLRKNRNLWREETKKGITVYPKVKAFGAILWREYRGHLKGHHWALYRSIKREFCPRVMLRGVDINKCSLKKLREVFKSPPTKKMDLARKIWVDRPFEDLADVREKGYLTAQVFVDEDPAQAIVEGLDKFFEKSKEQGSISALEAYRTQLISAQKNKLVNGLSNWTPIWSYYRLLKSELSKFLEQQKEESSEQDRSKEQTGVA